MLGEREDVEGLTGLHLTDGEWHGSAAELLYVQNGKVKGSTRLSGHLGVSGDTEEVVKSWEKVVVQDSDNLRSRVEIHCNILIVLHTLNNINSDALYSNALHSMHKMHCILCIAF